MAGKLMNELGAFGVHPAQYNQLAAGKRVGVSSSIGTYRREITGDCSPADLDWCLTLIYLMFTADRAHLATDGGEDEPRFSRLAPVLKRTRDQVAMLDRKPDMAFALRVQQL